MEREVRTLIFDIGGTVFDWNTAIVEALTEVLPEELAPQVDKAAFSMTCRAKFLELNTAVMRGTEPWHTSDQMLTRVVAAAWREAGLGELPMDASGTLGRAWRNMPAWSGAREALALLRTKYVVAPLTILSCTMAVGSSRRNGIDWDLILSCDVLGVYKPDPRCYIRAAEVLDNSPNEIMMVAAHPSDLRAAIASGYRSAYILPRLEDPGEDYSGTDFDEEFDIVARDFGDLAEQLI
ncbi:HAD-IA family hydrolase [Sinirhodobacter sp. WL0062]|uniref:HAD-IA family hydrolase n=1 Tax=Rhodobacter flavimaris TaxID=2907145 RepID=A0ABS8YUG0_9RHOB|nr:HAD-IA family hydrolase [Sinirhodobacter sp. WL0062]MCE5973118.1 HAD-IA family hydrolase [Sinirhodobacter sp. WL0062]